ncbi:hypothetical protein HX744_29610 [Pseudonocardia sp. ICBG1122]|nr:hypothetical protein [Pseudonocardia pini]
MIRRLRTTLEGRSAASAALRPSGRSGLVLIMVLVLAALTAVGVSRVKVETGVESFLPSSDPSVQRYAELARSFGGDPIVVLLRAPQAPACSTGTCCRRCSASRAGCRSCRTSRRSTARRRR